MNIFHNLVSKSVDGSGGKGLDNMSCAVVDLNKLRYNLELKLTRDLGNTVQD